MRTQETPPIEYKSLEQIITSIEDSLARVHAYCVQHTSSKPVEAAVIRSLLDLSGKAVLEIRKGLSAYPPDYFRNNGITGVTAVKNIQAFGKGADGYATAIENIVTLSFDNKDPENFQLVIHHELFHRNDMFAVSSPGKIVESIVSEQDWNSLFQVRSNPMVGDGREEYFDYGQGEGVEDRAVYASALLVPAVHHRLLARIQAEPDLLKKAVYEEKIRKIKKKYFEWSGGKMNDQYWEDLLAGKVVEGYFS